MLRWLVRMFRRESTADRQYGPIEVQGRQLRCAVCSHDNFWAHDVQLHTPLMTLLNLEEFNRVANCAICSRCGYIHWFLPPEGLPNPETQEDPGRVDAR